MEEPMKIERRYPTTLAAWLGFFTLFVIFSVSAQKQSTASADARHPYASDKPMPEPTLFGEGTLSTAEDDLNAAFTPDGRTVYFTRNFPGNKLGVILFSQFKNGKWQPPEIASFSGQAIDYDPFFSPDGSKLFYCSNRSESGKAKNDFDIWFVEKTANGWGAPKSVGEMVNTKGNEFYPSIASDGALYFSSNRPGGKGGFDIYRSQFADGKYTEPENLGEGVNTQGGEIDSYISPDQKFLVFAAYGRQDDLGGGSGDLYISQNQNGSWTKSKNLGPKINSPSREYCPIGSPDGKYFFFTSFRGALDKPLDKPLKNNREVMSLMSSTLNGRGNVYQVDLSALVAQGAMTSN
jgi:Tol biopolymer transport system component